MRKQIVVLALALSSLASCAFAEQPAANHYREVFKAGNFFIDYESEYKDCYIGKIIAAQNDMRMERNSFRLKGMLSAFGVGKKDYPDTLYREGKYYKFSSKKKATMALWNQLNDENIDPKGGWNSVQYSLAVPDEFLPIYAYDPYRSQSAAMGTPDFVETVKKIIDKKEYTCDKYILPIRSQAGNNLAEIDYYYCYDGDQLVFIEKVISANGKEYATNRIKIKSLTNNIPENIFDVPKGCKVYAVGIGDMNDLIEQPVLAEEY